MANAQAISQSELAKMRELFPFSYRVDNKYFGVRGSVKILSHTVSDPISIRLLIKLIAFGNEGAELEQYLPRGQPLGIKPRSYSVAKCTFARRSRSRKEKKILHCIPAIGHRYTSEY